MEYRKALEVRDQLAAPFLQSFQEDLRRAPKSARHFLETLADHVFDSEFQVGAAYESLNLDADELRREFQVAFGIAPKGYLRTLRLKVAKELLTSTKISIGLVSELVGYASSKTLGHAFKLHEGMSPSAFRRQKNSPSLAFSVDLPRKLHDERVDLDEAQSLLRYLQIHFRELLEAPVASHLVNHQLSVPELEKFTAQHIWTQIKDLPQDLQYSRIRQANSVLFTTPALFEFLKAESVVISRDHRKRGLQVAELALIAALSFGLPDLCTGKSVLWARAWANLGYSRRLSLQLEGAEEAYKKAEYYLPDNPPLEAHAEILFSKSLLRWYQRNFDQGIFLAETAIALYEQVPDREGVAKSLIAHAMLCDYQGHVHASIRSLSRAIELLPELNNTDITMAAYYHLARCYRKLKDYEKVKRILNDIKALAKRINIRTYTIYIQWFQGRVALDHDDYRAAENYLFAARDGFLLIEAKAHAGLIGIDLAIIYARQKRQDEALEAAGDAMAVLEQWKEHPRAGLAWRKLKRAKITQHLTVTDLLAIRKATDDFQEDPLYQQYFDFSVAAV